MVDSPTTRNRLRKQELGTNTNTWGDTKLNEVLDAIDQAMDGVLSIALTGDLTLSSTNYTTGDQTKQRVLIFTGALTSSATITLLAVQHEYNVVNTAGADLLFKPFAGTGVTIPSGYQGRIYCDGVNVVNGSATVLPGPVQVAGQVHGVVAGTASTDAVNKTQMEAAIATAGLPSSPGAVLVDSLDLTAGYLAGKVTLSVSGLTTTQVGGLSSLQLSVKNVGGNEKLKLSAGQGYVGGFLNGGTKSAQFTPLVGTEYIADFTASSWTVNLSGMTTPQVGQRIKLDCFGNFQPFLLGTVNGQTNLLIDAGFAGELVYSSATWGWN